MQTALFALLLVVFSASTAEAFRAPSEWRQSRSEFSADTTYFTSSSNFSSGGETADIDGSFENISARLAARYNLAKGFGAWVGGTLSSTSAERDGVNRTNTNLSEIFLGASKGIVLRRSFIVAAEFEGALSTDKIDPETQNSLTSDGVGYLHPSIFVQKDFGGLYVGGNAGFKYRDEGLAGLFTWNVHGGLLVGALDLALGLGGYETLLKDELDIATRNAVTDRVNAGSMRFYAFDPALIDVFGALNYRFSRKFAGGLNIAQSIDGERSASGLSIGVQLKYSFDLTREPVSKEPRKKGEPAFEVETKEIDPELFEEDVE